MNSWVGAKNDPGFVAHHSWDVEINSSLFVILSMAGYSTEENWPCDGCGSGDRAGCPLNAGLVVWSRATFPWAIHWPQIVTWQLCYYWLMSETEPVKMHLREFILNAALDNSD